MYQKLIRKRCIVQKAESRWFSRWDLGIWWDGRNRCVLDMSCVHNYTKLYLYITIRLCIYCICILKKTCIHMYTHIRSNLYRVCSNVCQKPPVPGSDSASTSCRSRPEKKINAVGGPAQWDDWVTAPCMWYMWYPRINMQKHVGKTMVLFGKRIYKGRLSTSILVYRRVNPLDFPANFGW